MEKSELIKSLESELKFYRDRLFAVFSYAIVLELFIITGRVAISTEYPLVANSIYTLVFLTIVLFVFRFHESYRKRIYKIRWERNELSKTEGRSEGYFPPPGDDKVFHPDAKLSLKKRLLSSSPSMQFVYLVFNLAVLGIALTWTGAHIRFEK